MVVQREDKFRFEDKDTDFPFYTGETLLKTSDIVLILIGLVFSVFMVFFSPIQFSLEISYILYFVIFAYITHGKLGIIFKRLKRRDIPLIFLAIIGEFLLVIALGFIIKSLGVPTSANPLSEAKWSILNIVILIFDMFGEEFFKFIIFILTLFGVYKFTGNRKLGVVLAIFLTMICFGLLHLGTYPSIVQSIVLIGFGSLVTVFCYAKTHNLWVSFLIHTIYDLICLAPAILGIF